MLKRSGLLRRNRIRSLREGDPIPESTPKRYRDGRGYIRLRWKLGVGEYVEVYEHRLVMGFPDGEVHHVDGDKANNDPANLKVLSKEEHALLHGEDLTAKSARATKWNGFRSQTAYEKNERRLARQRERQEYLHRIAEMYRAGMEADEIARHVGRARSNVYLALRAAGVVSRRVAGKRGEIPAKVRQVVKARACMRCERCGANLVHGGGQVHHRRPRKMGGSSAPDTNLPSNLLHLCGDCHRYIESYRADSYAHGWLLHADDNPADRPILLDRGSRWAYLTDSGDVSDLPPGESVTGWPGDEEHADE